MPLLAGRQLSEEYADDSLQEGATRLNVIVNELTVERFGFASPAAAIGGTFL